MSWTGSRTQNTIFFRKSRFKARSADPQMFHQIIFTGNVPHVCVKNILLYLILAYLATVLWHFLRLTSFNSHQATQHNVLSPSGAKLLKVTRYYLSLLTIVILNTDFNFRSVDRRRREAGSCRHTKRVTQSLKKMISGMDSCTRIKSGPPHSRGVLMAGSTLFMF